MNNNQTRLWIDSYQTQSNHKEADLELTPTMVEELSLLHFFQLEPLVDFLLPLKEQPLQTRLFGSLKLNHKTE